MRRWILVMALSVITLETACVNPTLPDTGAGALGAGRGLPYGAGTMVTLSRPTPPPSGTTAPSTDVDGVEPAPDPTCFAVEDEENWAVVAQGTRDVPFPVNAAFVRWDPSSCTDAKLLVGLTDGECPTRTGRQLLFEVDRDLGEVGMYGMVSLPAAPYDDMVKVEFRVPHGSAPADVWGTCFGAEGSLFVYSFGFGKGDPVAADFELRLTDCVDVGGERDITVTGSVDLTVPLAFAEACR